MLNDMLSCVITRAVELLFGLVRKRLQIKLHSKYITSAIYTTITNPLPISKAATLNVLSQFRLWYLPA
jgi:hypothetical protein